MWPAKVVKLIPTDWPMVVYQAGKISAELLKDVKDCEQLLGNADYQIMRFLSRDVNYRDVTLMPLAWTNLENARPYLTRIINAFEAYEQTQAGSRRL
jgi:hypothetical protein